jgi:hypothetical protein
LQPSQLPLPERASAYLRIVAFGSDPESRAIPTPGRDSADPDRLSKWTIDIRVLINGQTTARDLATFKTVIQELDELIEPISVTRAWTVDEANVTVRLVPRESFAEFAPIPDELGIARYALFSVVEGVTVEAWILVDSGTSDGDRQDTIREEITQIIGLPHDSWEYPDSTFYQGGNKALDFTELDKAVIRLLYDPRIEPGMTIEDLDRLGL